MTLATSNYNILKELYDGQTVENLTYPRNPFYALCPKKEDFEGKYKPIPFIYGDPQGRSATFADAQSRGAATSPLNNEFLLTRASDYSIAYLSSEVLLASQNNVGAFLPAARVVMDTAAHALARSISISMYKSGYGDIGTINNTVAGATTITLLQINDVTNFEVGMELDVAASVSGHVLKTGGSSGNGLIITKINRATGVLTFGYAIDDATNGIPTIANADTLFAAGDRQNSATPTRLKLTGLDGWVPTSAPGGSDSFFGVNRSVDSRLYGYYLDGTGMSIEEGLIDLSAYLSREGGNPDYVFMSPLKYAGLEKSLGSKIHYVDLSVNASVNFTGILIHGANGPIKVVPDRNCPFNRAYMLQLDTFELDSLGKAVRLFDLDGVTALRMPTSDGMEMRWISFSNLACKAPGWNGVLGL